MAENTQDTQTNGPTKEEILAYMFPKEFHCPVCDKSFFDFVLKKSKLRTISVDTDYRTVYKDINPNYYEVLFCTHCGYASLSSYFDKITESQQKTIAEKVSPNYKPHEFPSPLTLESAIERYKQALVCATAINAKASHKAFINLRMAWLLRDTKHKDIELKFTRDAYEGLKEAFSTERFPLGAMDEHTAKYVIADLARRLGEMGEAMRWVGDVVVARGIPGALKERATNLKDMIRDNIRT